MTYDSLVNRGDYFSAHYLAEVLPKDLKSGLLAAWKQREDEARAEAERAAAAGADGTSEAAPGNRTPTPCRSPLARACVNCAAPTSAPVPPSPFPRTRTARRPPGHRGRLGDVRLPRLVRAGPHAERGGAARARLRRQAAHDDGHARPTSRTRCRWRTPRRAWSRSTAAGPPNRTPPSTRRAPAASWSRCRWTAATPYRRARKLASFLFACEDAPRVTCCCWSAGSSSSRTGWCGARAATSRSPWTRPCSATTPRRAANSTRSPPCSARTHCARRRRAARTPSRSSSASPPSTRSASPANCVTDCA